MEDVVVFEPELNIEHLWQLAACETEDRDYIGEDFDPSRSERSLRSDL